MASDAQKPMANVAMLSDTGFHWHVPLTFSRHTDMTLSHRKPLFLHDAAC